MIDDATPDFCCAILAAPGGRLWLEQRPLSDSAAPGQLTCFGGGREVGESPDACIRRELLEELNYVPPEPPELRVRLFLRGGLCAFFYAVAAPPPGHPLRLEPGYGLIVAGAEEVLAYPCPLPISTWHLAALRAHFAGEPHAHVNA